MQHMLLIPTVLTKDISRLMLPSGPINLVARRILIAISESMTDIIYILFLVSVLYLTVTSETYPKTFFIIVWHLDTANRFSE